MGFNFSVLQETKTFNKTKYFLIAAMTVMVNLNSFN